MMKRGGRIVLWMLCGAGVVVLFTLLTQQLWNWLVPRLFSGPSITFYQTLGLLLLSKILLSPLGYRTRCHTPSAMGWKSRLQEKFNHMSPEEREAFKRKMQDKWCPTTRSSANETRAND